MSTTAGIESTLRRARGWTLAAVVSVVFVLRMFSGAWSSGFAPNGALRDSFDYLDVARHGWWSPPLYVASRPPLYPALLSLFGRNPTLIVLLQTAVYCAAFSTLGLVGFRAIRSRVVAWVFVGFVSAFAAQASVAAYNANVLTESLSISLSVLVIASWWNAASVRSTRSIRWAWAATVAWLLVRDTGVVAAIVMVVAALIACLFTSERNDRALNALFFGAWVVIAASAFMVESAQIGSRSMQPVDNVVGARVLNDEQLTRFFAGHGMPLNAALRARRNAMAWDHADTLAHSPQLAAYRRWRDERGERTLLQSSVQQFTLWTGRIGKSLNLLIGDVSHAYDFHGVRARLPRQIPLQLTGPSTARGLVAWLALGAVAFAVLFMSRGRRIVGAALAALLFAAVVEFYYAYVGDAAEGARHVLVPLVRFRLVLLIATTLAIDEVVRRVRDRGATPIETND